VSEVRRPTGVGLIAVLLIATAAVSLAGAAVAFGLGGLAVPDVEAAERPALGVGYLLLAAAQIAVAWGFWTLRGWAWTAAILLSALDILVGVIQLLLVGVAGIGLQGLLSIVVAAIVVAYLMRRQVLDAFVLRSLERADRRDDGRA
jgi:hypothetical protein